MKTYSTYKVLRSVLFSKCRYIQRNGHNALLTIKQKAAMEYKTDPTSGKCIY